MLFASETQKIGYPKHAFSQASKPQPSIDTLMPFRYQTSSVPNVDIQRLYTGPLLNRSSWYLHKSGDEPRSTSNLDAGTDFHDHATAVLLRLHVGSTGTGQRALLIAQELRCRGREGGFRRGREC